MPQLNWNEIKRRAIVFANNWAGAVRERSDAQTFWNEFFDVYGIRRAAVASFEVPVQNLAGHTDFIDLFWKGKLLAEHKSRGKPLDRAQSQAMDYIQSLQRDGRGDEVPRFVVVSDFARIALHDLEPVGRRAGYVDFDLKDFPKHVRDFSFLIDIATVDDAPEDDANFQATKKMAGLHDALQDGGYAGHDLEQLLVRILFCLFADDTGIFADDPAVKPFQRFVETHTGPDGSDLGPQLLRFFAVLDRPRDQRQTNLDEDLAALPHVNGRLFSERLDFADFTAPMRATLIDCCKFDWSKISPAVFGSLFQDVMKPRDRRQLGAHYTSERDILKLIRSLFLDDLRGELEDIQSLQRGRAKRLHEFQDKLRGLTFLDPACGCGNFLVIAYRELRLLELDALRTLRVDEPQRLLNLAEIVRVNVDQFYGIEIEEWPARIAEVAMWLMDHQMNQLVADEFALPLLRLPLRAAATIRHGNALRIDWNDVLPAERCSYVMGNPPFVGHQWRSESQQRDHDDVWAGVHPQAGRLDLVACWYLLARQYLTPGRRGAFVSTNSITQGEQARILSAALWTDNFQIAWAHRTFEWTSEARGRAHVHVVVVGFSPDVPTRRLLTDQDTTGKWASVPVQNINAYLVDGPNVILQSRGQPLSNVPPMNKGSQPTDGGHLILNGSERAELIECDPGSERWMKRYLGGEEFLNGGDRWCLWLKNASPSELRSHPVIMDRIEAVRANRLRSPTRSVRDAATTPMLFTQDRQPDGPFLAMPEVSSFRREYIQVGFLTPEIVPSNQIQIVAGGNRYHLGVLSSTMHMAWVKTVSGRLKSDFRYSPAVYNNYPWPYSVTDIQREAVEAAATGVLNARAAYTGQTLADLYDPLAMPKALRDAHHKLDRAVDRSYRPERFDTDRQRVEFLFRLYEQLTAPLVPAAGKRPRGKRPAKPPADSAL